MAAASERYSRSPGTPRPRSRGCAARETGIEIRPPNVRRPVRMARSHDLADGELCQSLAAALTAAVLRRKSFQAPRRADPRSSGVITTGGRTTEGEVGRCACALPARSATAVQATTRRIEQEGTEREKLAWCASSNRSNVREDFARLSSGPRGDFLDQVKSLS